MRGKRAYATVMAMLLLVIGTTMCAWLYAMVGNATAIDRNEGLSARVQMARESGLAFMQLKIKQAAGAHPIYRPDISGTNPPDPDVMMLADLGKALVAEMPGEAELNTDVLPAIQVKSIPLKDGAFTSQLTLSDRNEHGFTLSVTGSVGPLASKVGQECTFTPKPLDDWMLYPLMSRKTMSIKSGSIYDIQGNSSVDLNRSGTDYHLSSGGYVLSYDGSPATEPQFPPQYLPGELYAKLNGMVNHGLTVQAGGSDISVLRNCYIRPNTTIKLAPSSTIAGIVYVGYPNNIDFDAQVQMNGVIIYEQPAKATGNPTMTMERTVKLSTDPLRSKAEVVQAFVNSGESTEDARRYAAMIQPWIIHAPDTDLVFPNGESTAQIDFWGSLHVRSISKAAGYGSAGPEQFLFHGTIMCEDSVTVAGNRKLCISSQARNADAMWFQEMQVAVRHGGYWENFQ